MAGRNAISSNLKKQLWGVLLPMLLVTVSICLGLILTDFVIGEKGSAESTPRVLFVEPAVLTDDGLSSPPFVGERGTVTNQREGHRTGIASPLRDTGGVTQVRVISAADEGAKEYLGLATEFSIAPEREILLAEADPIDKLLSTPSPYENLTGVAKERTQPPARVKPKAASASQASRKSAATTVAEVSSSAADKRVSSGADASSGSAVGVADADGNGMGQSQPAKGTSENSKEQANSLQANGQTHEQTNGQVGKQGAKANSANDKSKETPVHLFNTVSLFPKPVSAKTAPQWHRVIKTQGTPPPIFSKGTAKRMPPNVAKRWFALREKIESGNDFAKAKAVNTFFNTWPYRTDDVVWGVPEYWATPEEFLEKSGDCEDYAITKYYALRSLGVSADKLRVVAVKDSIRGIGHAVLTIFINDTAYVLDNLSPYLLEHTVLKNYRPQFSVNEHYRWGHARIVKKK